MAPVGELGHPLPDMLNPLQLDQVGIGQGRFVRTRQQFGVGRGLFPRARPNPIHCLSVGDADDPGHDAIRLPKFGKLLMNRDHRRLKRLFDIFGRQLYFEDRRVNEIGVTTNELFPCGLFMGEATHHQFVRC